MPRGTTLIRAAVSSLVSACMPWTPSATTASTVLEASSSSESSARNTKRNRRARASAPNAEKARATPKMPRRAASANSMARAASGRGGGELAQRALEDLGRLTARDQVAVVDDHRGHRMNAERLPVALALAHLGRVLVRIEDRRGAGAVEPRVGRGAEEDVARPGVLGARVIR